ncbi:hypothetical protein [Paenibacillus chitinolyticus]|uniref:hypothetical protein n=1 Tax=Paenibacillus chitinolyticus TaxID=79263 RepID=UPI0036434035
MDWAKEEPSISNEHSEHEQVTEVRVEKVYNSSTDLEAGGLDQIDLFFLIPVLMNKGNRKDLYLPVISDDFCATVIEKFLRYFAVAEKVYENNRLANVNFMRLTTSALEKLENIIQSDLDPFTRDLFFKARSAENPISKLKCYTVQAKEFLEHETSRDFISPDLWRFLQRTVLEANGELNISLIGWMFDESLTRSVALRYFVEHAKSVDLMVSQDNRVVYFRVT